jgi:uncharacterized protein YyaL (SSP411 family)
MTEHRTSTVPGRANRLIGEKSPYLLQHAHNPVDWHPWGDEAFRLAKEKDKPIFLSIGYSSCHWCHVMAEESFENEEVAALLNEHFVCVKVDREERPDIDAVYMMAAQLMSGTGGWPLTIILTPDGRPFFAATYLPKESRQGMTGLTTIVPIVSQFWKERRDEVVETSKKVAEAVRMATQPTSAGSVGIESLMEGYEGLRKSYDPRHGGFGRAPKFPTPHRLTFLLRYWKRTGAPEALEMVQRTLVEMRRGGIFDQLGGGFHRYSTDRSWTVPHFEKMLYDQALLLMAYVEGWQATQADEFESTAREVADYVMERLASPQGGFYSAEDADSEGVEGKYYTWSESELSSFLAPDELSEARRVFGVTGEGNIEVSAGERANVLRLEGETTELSDTVRRKMRERRQQRTRPFLDDKIMADWNGLMIAGLAKAYGAWREPRHLDAARRAANFVLDAMMNERGRHHVYRDGTADGPAFLDDHAFMAWGLLELYFADPDPRWLEEAVRMAEWMVSDFADPSGGFFQTSGEELMGRVKEVYDGAVPSGNSVALTVLYTLHAVTGREDLRQEAERAERALSGAVVRSPDAHAQFLNAVDLRIGPTIEMTLTGKRKDVEPFLAVIGQAFLPHRMVVHASGDGRIERLSPLAKGRDVSEVAAYVCRERTCLPAVRDASSLERLIKS